jgi:hypothetical protein
VRSLTPSVEGLEWPGVIDVMVEAETRDLVSYGVHE